MLNFTYISMKNFFSFGNVPQEVHLDKTTLALILGNNKDAAVTEDWNGYRNGVGKSAIIQGIVYGLYGKSIDNSIKIPNLVNKINQKNCEVQLNFEKNNTQYKVQRGRNPTYFTFTYLNEEGSWVDVTRGEGKDTQTELDNVIEISQNLFEHIVVLNANVEPFLGLSVSKQRDMIEELLGITQLTEKANILKDSSKESARLAAQEKFKIDTLTESNLRISESINTLMVQEKQFNINRDNELQSLYAKLQEMEDIDFQKLYKDAEHKENIIKNNEKFINLSNEIQTLTEKYEKYEEQLKINKDNVLQELLKLSEINIKEEIEKHELNAQYGELRNMLNENLSTKKVLEGSLQYIQRDIKNLNKSLEDKNSVLNELQQHKCPTCNSDISHKDEFQGLIQKCSTEINEIKAKLIEQEAAELKVQEQINDVDIFEVPDNVPTVYNSIFDAKMHNEKINTLTKEVESEKINIYQEDLILKLNELDTMQLLDVPEALSSAEIQSLEYELKNIQRDIQVQIEKINPYTSQIETLKSTSIKSIDYNEYERFSKLSSHQDFLSKLLLNKDSFVRKRIIDQNLTYLNSKLQYYILKSGSQHNVEFMNDLSVDITMKGQSYDFKQLSRGERTRIIISLNLAFRETYEMLYQSINILLVDELLDQGLDSNGCLDSWRILNDMAVVKNKNIYVVSHRDELLEKANDVLLVQKENNFSTILFTTSDNI